MSASYLFTAWRLSIDITLEILMTIYLSDELGKNLYNEYYEIHLNCTNSAMEINKLNDFLKNIPDDHFPLWSNIVKAKIFSLTDNFQEALPLYEIVSANKEYYSPTIFHAINQSGGLHINLGNIDRALSAFESIPDLFLDFWNFPQLAAIPIEVIIEMFRSQIGKATCYEKQGMLPVAETKYRDLVEVFSTYDDLKIIALVIQAKTYLGSILMRHGERNKHIAAVRLFDQIVYDYDIRLLAGPYRDMRRGIISKAEFEVLLRSPHNFSIERSITETRAGEQGDMYFVTYPANTRNTRLLEWHLTHGNSYEARYCLRIYFSWDKPDGVVVIGWLPSHLYNRLS